MSATPETAAHDALLLPPAQRIPRRRASEPKPVPAGGVFARLRGIAPGR